LKRDLEVDPTDSIARGTGRKLDFIIIGVLTVTVGLLLVDRFMLSPRRAASSAASTSAASIPPSIAVLPFLDLSEAKDQEYFSDGLSEELLDLLAQVPGLHVAGRTSSFSFKGKKATIPEIGKTLNVAAVLEGSVRKSGDRIRITAQLINVADDYHIWSKTYDRKLTDVFALQDEIAGAVVDALKLKLLPAQRPTVTKHFVPSPEAYDHFLLGRQSSRLRTQAALVGALDAFHRAIALEPNYAAAYAQLAYTEDENAY
jgi:TolB-like protein